MAQSTLVTLSTGLGKTVIFSSLAHRFLSQFPNKRVLVMAHREELIFQAADKLRRCCSGEDIGIEMADMSVNEYYAAKPRIVVSSVQTLNSVRDGRARMEKFDPREFGLVVTDECFPAGTLIDGRPIESIAAGDLVNSFNHETGVVEQRVVSAVMKRPLSGDSFCDLVVVTLDNGVEVTCTPGHPVYTLDGGYVEAAFLGEGTEVLVDDSDKDMRGVRDGVQAEELEFDDDAGVLGRMQGCAEGCPEKSGVPAVSELRCDSGMQWFPETRIGEAWQGVLQRRVQEEGVREGVCCCDGGDEQEARLRADEEAKSDAASGCSREGLQDFEGDELEAVCAWREWSWTDSSGGGFGAGSWYASERGGDDWHGEVLGLPMQLQGRRRAAGREDRHRGGWSLALLPKGAAVRQEEARVPRTARVVSVAFYKSGGDRTVGGMCPAGEVFNLEVEGNHNYFANGVLVHNCHRCTAPSYRAVYSYFMANPECRHLGVTATPDRSDETALGAVYESVAFEYGILDGIDNGWLVPIEQYYANVEGLDLSTCTEARTKDGRRDLRDKQVAAAMEQEGPLHGVVDATRTLSGSRKTLVFAASVEHGHLMADIFNRHENGSAVMIDGKTPTEERRYLIDKYRAGDFKYMVNMGVFLEGFDCPDISCIAMARPTKSRSLYCLHEDAEVLGRNGWVGIDDEQPSEVAGFDLSDGSVRWTECVAKTARPVVDGEEFVSIDSGQVGFCVTGNHTMVYRRTVRGTRGGCQSRSRTQWMTTEAAKMMDWCGSVEIPVAGIQDVPGLPIPDCQVALIGWVLTDGCVNRLNGQLSITQSAKQPWNGSIDEMLTECGLKFTRKQITPCSNGRFATVHDTVRWTVSRGRPRGRDADRCGWGALACSSCITKSWSAALDDLSRSQLLVLLNAMNLANGSKHVPDEWTPRSMHIHTARKDVADGLQSLCARRGVACNISVRPTKHGVPLYCMHVKDKVSRAVAITASDGRPCLKSEPASGRVWCLQSGTGTLITRFRGKVAIVGNSQVVGRGLRPLDGLVDPFREASDRVAAIAKSEKQNCLVLDFVGNSGRHKLISTADVLGGKEPDEIVERARKNAEKKCKDGRPVDMREELEIAREQLERELQKRRQRESLRKNKVIFKARVSTEKIDPFCVFDVIPHREQGLGKRRGATDKQIETLSKFGVGKHVIEGLSFTKASQMLDVLIKRRKSGLCSVKQANILRGYGYPTDLTFENAKKVLDVLSRSQWRAVPWERMKSDAGVDQE